MLLAKIDNPGDLFAQLSFGPSLGHTKDTCMVNVFKPSQDSLDLGEIPFVLHHKLKLIDQGWGVRTFDLNNLSPPASIVKNARVGRPSPGDGVESRM